jgi:hypothetical protein
MNGSSSRWIMYLCLIGIVGTFAVNAVLQVATLSQVGRLAQPTTNAPDLSGSPNALPRRSAELTPVSLTSVKRVTVVPAWTVSVYGADNAPTFSAARKGPIAGRFMHTGDWITMNEHHRHSGVYAGNKAVFVMDGLFEAENSGSHYFATHLRVVRAGQEFQHSVSCQTKVTLPDGSDPFIGSLQAAGDADKAASLGSEPIGLEQGFLYPIRVEIACELPHTVALGDVMVRLCVREEAEAAFRPVRPVSPVTCPFSQCHS